MMKLKQQILEVRGIIELENCYDPLYMVQYTKQESCQLRGYEAFLILR
jgi:hypothetical protein